MVGIMLTREKSAKLGRWRNSEWRKFNRKHGYSWKEDKYFLEAAERGKTVGYAAFGITGKVGTLKELIVSEGARKKGIGTALISGFEEICRKKGCHLLELKTNEFQARPFYEKNGWQVFHTVRNGWFHFRWFLMEKRI